MTLPWWTLLHVWTAVAAAPVTAAEPLEPIALPLPQTTDYAYELVKTVGNTTFSTDPKGAVLADIDSSGSSSVEIFLSNHDFCLAAGQTLAYRLGIRNNGSNPAAETTVQVSWPEDFSFISSSPLTSNTTETTADWNLGTISPGETLTVFFTLQHQNSENPPPTTTITAAAFYNNLSSSNTSHSIDPCPDFPSPSPGGSPTGDKQPAIICHPADESCVASQPELGARFQEASPAIICSEHDPSACAATNPELGVRFQEAVADILPGECTVIEDGIVSSPEFHDAFVRRGKPSSFYLKPLFDSGRDFSKLIHQNELGSIKGMTNFRRELQEIHQKHWGQRQELIGRVLEGTAQTGEIRRQIDQWHNDWASETQRKQGEFRNEYRQLIEERKSRFDPVADQAVSNAQTSILRACGPPPSDGDLSNTLPEVKQVYEASLNEREQDFTTTQNRFVNRDDEPYPIRHRTATWKQALRSALDLFDDGDRQALSEFANSIGVLNADGFAIAWELSYTAHQESDREADDRIKLDHWEVALDNPKTIATVCETNKQFGPEVEVTWCETGNYPEFVFPIADTVRSPAPVFVPGGSANIDSQQVIGISCRGLPGDPFWADDCSCNCNQLIPDLADGNIRFCQSRGNITSVGSAGDLVGFKTSPTDSFKNLLSALVPPAQALTIFTPKPSPPTFSPVVSPNTPGGRAVPITRHDIHITGIQECLAERAKHSEPFF